MQRLFAASDLCGRSPVIYHDVDSLSESPSVGFRAKPSDESSGRNGPSRGLVPLKATTRKIETTDGGRVLAKGHCPSDAQHAPVALGADESGNLGFCIVSIPQYRSASTSRAVARSLEVDGASSHTAPGDVVAPWPDPKTCALNRAAVQWHARDSRCRSAPPSPARRRALSVRL